MKTTASAIIGAIILLTSVNHTFAVENLQLTIQSSNAIVLWPSSQTNGETFIVQYRQTLNPTDSWQTLTDDLAAATDTNLTFFIHSNSVEYPPAMGGGTNGGGVPNPSDTNDDSGLGTNNWSVDTGFYRVVRDGAHLYGITNGMILHDELITPIEFAVGSTDEIVGVTFYDENNSPIIGASAFTNSAGGWILNWNTTMSFNGDYNIYAEINFASDNPVVSNPVTVTVNNTISFPNYFSRVYGDQLWVYAETIPDAAYEIDMFDENSNSLGAFTGNADGDGVISFYWDLTDGNGNTFDSTNFYGTFIVDTSSEEVQSMIRLKSGSSHSPDFVAPVKNMLHHSHSLKANSVHLNGSGSSSSANQLWVKEGNWTPNDNWVVAYAPLTDPGSDNTALYESYMMAGTSSDGNEGVLEALENGTDSNLSPGNSHYGPAFELKDAATRAQLLSNLASLTYENFYFFGHGNDSAISAYNDKESGISSDQIAYALGNVPLGYAGPPQLINVDPPIMVYPTINNPIFHAAEHPYRFTFLDGCETASGTFCEAFGVPALTVSTNFFATAGVESRAFLGYTREISFNTAQYDWRSMMLFGFLSAWRSGQIDLNHCVGSAQAVEFQPMDSSATIYGAYDMKADTRTRRQ